MSECIYSFGYYTKHRRALEKKLGRPITKGMLACHTCNHPRCYNPDHLYEGSYSDNILDRWHGSQREHRRSTDFRVTPRNKRFS